MNRGYASSGFTLIEVMIALVIVGIVSAYAYASYAEQVQSSRRIDAQTSLVSFAQAMERAYTTDGTYAGADGDATTDISSATEPTIFPAQIPIDGDVKYYDLFVMSASDNSYVLRAIPTGIQAGDGYLQITASGYKGWDKYGDGTLVNW